jgi:voltage-gated potassium channel Kch
MAQDFIYFSTITLTTLGYGDITPLNPFARTAVMFEAFTGQLYPAILIARLVSLSVDSRGQGKAD